MRTRVLPVMFAMVVFAATFLQCGQRCAWAQPFTFAGNAQHSGISAVSAKHLNAVRWSAVIDPFTSGANAHYGEPVITSNNTVVVGIQSTNGLRITAFDGANGRGKYSLPTNYRFPGANWRPVYQPVIAPGPSGARLYYPAAGGTVLYIDNPDSDTPGPATRLCFYTNLAAYAANSNNFNNTVLVNTPITSDTNGTIYFGFFTQGNPPRPLRTNDSGFVRIDAAGIRSYITATQAGGDAGTASDSHNCAPALSNDGLTLYVAVRYSFPSNNTYLVALDAATLSARSRVLLSDPWNGSNLGLPEDSTSSPVVGPDGDVFFGVYGGIGGGNGLLLHFSADLQTTKLFGAFGWDNTPAIVPASMVPAYRGTSSYLLFSKYNNYQGGVHRIAILDPNAPQIDPRMSGLSDMREVLASFGCSPDGFTRVREWCINAAAVDPGSSSVFAAAEDGRLYRWNLANNSLSETVTLQNGIGEPYVPSAIGPDGTVYVINAARLYAVANPTKAAVNIYSSAPDQRVTVIGEPVTFTAVVSNIGPLDLTPSGTVSFQDVTYRGNVGLTNTLGTTALTNGVATLTTSALIAGGNFPTNCQGNHFITAFYSGDTNFPSGSSTLVQKIHASASRLSLQFGSLSNDVVSVVATIAPEPPAPGNPTGFVSFWDNWMFLGQAALNSSRTASITMSNPVSTDHFITAEYASDVIYASSSARLTVLPPDLRASLSRIDPGLRIDFSNVHGVTFTVLGSTDLALPLSNWPILGPAIELAPGQFRFVDYDVTNSAQRFYRVRSP